MTKIEGVYDTPEQAYQDYKERYQRLQNAVVGNTGCSAILCAEQHRKSHRQLQTLLELCSKHDILFNGVKLTGDNIDRLLGEEDTSLEIIYDY